MFHIDNPVEIEKILDNATNVAELLDGETLADIGKLVVEGYNTDRDSRSDWEDANEDAMRLALQVADVKNTPWEGAANVKYPLLTTAALQFSSRAYPALIPGSDIVKGRVIGFDETGDKMERSIRIGKHMSYQLIEQMEDWEEEMDKLCLTLPILGCLFKKTYHDTTKGVNVSEVIFPKDLVVNYWSPTLEKSQRVTHVLQMTDNDIHERVAGGLYLDEDLVKSQIDKDEGENDKGLEAPQEDDTMPYNILEQHLVLDLDGDGYKEPYVVIVHEDSEKVLRITPRYTAEDIIGNAEKIIRINATQYFTKFGFIPSPDGSIYDLGFGTLLGPMNDTINTLLNQLLDAGTMNTLGGGFIGRGIRIKGGNHSFKPNEWKQVNSTGDDLRKGIFPLPTKEPSNVLFQLLNTMVSAGERLSSVTDMMTGEIPGQNTKATVAMAAIEQGMKVFSAIYKRIYRSMKKEFRKLYKLNKEHMALEEYFTILDVGQEKASTISIIDYRLDDTDVIPYADPTVATEAQKLSRVEALGSLLQIGTIDEMEYTKRYLEATEQTNIAQLIKQPEPPQPDPEMELKQAQLEFDREKFMDESQREWAKLDIESKLAGSKMSKEEIEGIVAMTLSHQKGAKIAVDAIQRENEVQIKREPTNQGLAGAPDNQQLPQGGQPNPQGL